MQAVCEDFEAELMEFNGEANHVHLLVNFPPKVAVSRLVNSLKGVSSRRAPPRVPRPRPPLLAGTAPVVRLVLRRVGRRCAAQHRAAVYRAGEPATPTLAEVNSADPCTQPRSDQFTDSLHHRAEARCTANTSGSQG
ncbi:hypothetical protein GCM10010505_29140 [Kitasatospora aburaviensis]